VHLSPCRGRFEIKTNPDFGTLPRSGFFFQKNFSTQKNYPTGLEKGVAQSGLVAHLTTFARLFFEKKAHRSSVQSRKKSTTLPTQAWVLSKKKLM
jgi:hypothetical protein